MEEHIMSTAKTVTIVGTDDGLGETLLAAGHSLPADTSEADTMIVRLSGERDQLRKCFAPMQSFVQRRARKRSGYLVVLLPSGFEGNRQDLAIQGSLVGLVKTISREYGKRGIRASAYEISEQTDLAKVLDIAECVQGEIINMDYDRVE
jgi:hypothetical protein